MAATLFAPALVGMPDNNGDPLNGGKLYFYEPGTSTLKDTFSDSGLTTANANPVVLDANGRADIYLNGNYKLVIKDADDNTIRTSDNINPVSASTAGNYNQVKNGSFEDNSSGDGKTPDEWTLTEESGSTVALDTTDQQHGAQSIKFTSTGNGGGNVLTDNFIEVNPNRALDVSWLMKSDVAGVRNLVQVIWYDENQGQISTSSLYDEDTSNPTSWTKKQFQTTPPANARFAKLQMYGCHPSDATSGSTWFDDVQVVVMPYGGALQTGDGVYTPNATGGDQGADTVNVNEYYRRGSLLVKTESVVDLTNGGSNDTSVFNLLTSARTGTKLIFINLNEASLDGSEDILVQIGDSGGFESSGYSSNAGTFTSSSQSDSGATSGLHIEGNAGRRFSGVITLSLLDSSTNTWSMSYSLGGRGTTGAVVGGCVKSLSGELTQVRIASAGGTPNNFDNGNASVVTL